MGHFITEVILWIYWTVLEAIIVLAIPLIVCYALLFDEDDPMTICSFCGGMQAGSKYKCPVCGRRLACYMPDQEEICQQREAIRSHWPQCRIRNCEGYQEATIPLVGRASDGMRRREKEDGGSS